MLSTKTKEHIRRRAALGLPRWGTLLVSLGVLAGCVAFTGSQLHVVKITDTHGAQGMAITSAHDIKTLMQQAGIAAPDTEDELEITEDAGLDQIPILRAYTVPVTVDGGVQEVVVTGGTVGDVLAEAGITLGPDDWIEPALDTPAQENTMPQSEIGRLMLSLQENPNDPAALIALGSELIRNGELQSARTFLERAETADVNNPDPSYLLGYISHLEKKEDEAIRYMEKSLSIKEQPAVHYSIGTIYCYFLNQKDRARDHWNRALAMPGCSDVQKKLIEAELSKLGQN